MSLVDPNYRYAMAKFAGDGSETDWSVNFEGSWINEADVVAWYQDANDPASAVELGLTLLSQSGDSSTWRTDVPAPAGKVVYIVRQTQRAEPLVDFVDRSRMTSANLNTITRQAILSVAELEDSFQEFRAQTQDVSDEALLLAQQANDKADANTVAVAGAVSTANSAQAAAASAVTTANNALAGVSSATDAANAANQAAADATAATEAATALVENIQGEVDAAVATANDASAQAADAASTALGLSDQIDAAVDNATNALNTANAIDAKAQEALDNSEAAVAAAQPATTSQSGVVRLATNAETSAGASDTLAVRPAGLKPLLDAKADATATAAALATKAAIGAGSNVTFGDITAVRASGDVGVVYFGTQAPGSAPALLWDGTLLSILRTNALVQSASGDAFIRLSPAGGASGRVRVAADGALALSAAANTVYLRPNGDASSTGQMTVATSGNVTINGSCSATGGFQPGSSIKLKKALRDNPYGLDAVLSLRTKIGKYRKWYNSDDKLRVFLIAEDIKEHIPEAHARGVYTVENGEHKGEYDGYHLEQLVAVLVKAVQELHAEVEELRSNR